MTGSGPAGRVSRRRVPGGTVMVRGGSMGLDQVETAAAGSPDMGMAPPRAGADNRGRLGTIGERSGMKTISLFAAALAIAGCAAGPTPAERAAADYGAYPADYQETVVRYMGRMLKDPDSARYEFPVTPIAAWRGGGSTDYGYAVCALINARNSYGGYTGARPSYFFIRNGVVLETLHGDGRYLDGVVMSKCRQ